jgi:hypothetical protein
MNQRLLLPAMVLGSLLSPLPAGLPGSPAAASAATPAAPAPTQNQELQRCAPPQPGRYLAMGQGEALGEPVAQLVSETWSADGRISGIRLERRGRLFREAAYTGLYRPISLCRVAIERTYGEGTIRSQAVLDLGGHPRYSLGTLPDVVVASRWFRQGTGACTASLLDGTVLSSQQGQSWKKGTWQTNAVVQRESWQAGQVRGIAISSYGPTIEEATYKGSISVTPDCLATVVEKDSLGVTYNYRALVLADGSGYLYLQTDPNDLTVAWLERLRP